LSEECLAQGDKKGSAEALKNIELAKSDAVPKFDPFQNLCHLQKRWQELMEYTSKKEVNTEVRNKFIYPSP
jgi:hypothetical protein